MVALVEEQQQDYHHYSGTSYANENYFRRESSMDRQWADERSRAMIESLVAPYHPDQLGDDAETARVKANIADNGELSPRSLARQQLAEERAIEADGGRVTENKYEDAPFGI